jgi:penicillin-binding protein 1C
VKNRFMAILLSIAIIFPLLAYFFCAKPELKTYVPYSTAYYDVDGNLLRLRLAKDERYRLYESLENLSPKMVEATVLYEDQGFYSHVGVDVVALLRAFWTTYITKERRVGASTIVMQVARLRWQLRSNTLSGKLLQILRAIQLSRHYSKQEILEAYLNLTPYGGNIEGVAAASIIYFNKKPRDLSLLEALTLAVIPQNPNKRNPTTAQGYSHLLEARNILFKRWTQYHPEDSDKAKFMDLKLGVRSSQKLPFEAPHFINFLAANASEWDNGYIETTLSLKQQRLIEQVVKNYVHSKQKMGITNASALLVNHQTMAIEAMIGSSDFFNSSIFGQVNGVSAKRSPGSALKPFVYALAMDQGLIHPLSLMRDSPQKFGGFTPENYDKQFMGPISVQEALIESRNVPAVHLQSRLTDTSFYQFLVEAGVAGLKNEAHYGLALALGGGEVTAMELAGLYATLANGGERTAIKSLLHSATTPAKRLLSPEASFITLDMLKHNSAPDALAMHLSTSRKNDIPWKTGTSWAFRDAWAVGISGPYVLVVWVGNFDGSGNESFIGRTAAGPLFFRIMEAVYPPQNWQVGDLFDIDNMNVKQLEVCSNTGDLYEKHCPATEKSWFIPGVSPIKLSNIYREIPINPVSGKRACFHQPGVTELEVYEFWPSEFLQVYTMAGISLKTPPEYEEGCSLDVTSTFGTNPVITSPQTSVDYVFRFGDKDELLIPLTAHVDSDVTNLHWFINAAHVASSTPGEAVFWKASPGDYEVRVVDEEGRSEIKKFRVISAH